MKKTIVIKLKGQCYFKMIHKGKVYTIKIHTREFRYMLNMAEKFNVNKLSLTLNLY